MQDNNDLCWFLNANNSRACWKAKLWTNSKATPFKEAEKARIIANYHIALLTVIVVLLISLLFIIFHRKSIFYPELSLSSWLNHTLLM